MARLKSSLIHGSLNYTIQELAALHEISPSAAKAALRKFPEALTETKPILVIGRILKQQVVAHRQYKKKSAGLSPASFKCAHCKRISKPAESMGEVVHGVGAKIRRLEGICDHCGGLMSKLVGVTQRDAIEADLGNKIEGEW